MRPHGDSPGLFRHRRRGRFRGRSEPPPDRPNRRHAGFRTGFCEQQLQPLSLFLHPASSKSQIKINLHLSVADDCARFLNGFLRASKGGSHDL
jgi:hypothetical protein